jgi:hypothetical protein
MDLAVDLVKAACFALGFFCTVGFTAQYVYAIVHKLGTDINLHVTIASLCWATIFVLN